MAMVNFKKGLFANLPAAKSEGTIYVTTDERALYLDVDGSTRIRIGDFQEFATLTELQANTNPSTTALYYVSDVNCLAKWNGTGYVQINLDTGATSVEVTGTGNAIGGVAYNPTTRKLTFTKNETFTTSSDVEGQIDTKVGVLKIGDETFATVKAYVDKKTDGIATDTALETLTGRVTTVEGKVDTLNGNKTTVGSVAKAIADLQGDTESTVADVDARVCTIEDNYVDNLDVDTAINKAIGTNPDKKTVVELIADAKTEATYDDTVLSGKVDTLIGTDTGKSARTIANEELAKQLIPEGAQESLDTLGEIAAWIQSHPNDASAMNAAIEKLQTILAGIGGDGQKATVVAYVTDAIAALSIGDYAKAADLTTLADRVDTLEDDSHTHANKTELDKIASGDKAKWDTAATKAGTAVQSVASGSANGTIAVDGTDVSVKGLGSAAYAETTAFDTAGAATTAETNAKTYADGLMTWGTF